MGTYRGSDLDYIEYLCRVVGKLINVCYINNIIFSFDYNHIIIPCLANFECQIFSDVDTELYPRG